MGRRQKLSLYTAITRGVSLFVVFPVLFYCAGYLYTVGYYSAMGAPWLVQDMDRASIIEKGLFPLTSFFMSIIVSPLVVSKWPNTKKYASWAVRFCTYFLFTAYISVVIWNIPTFKSQAFLEICYSIWSILLGIYVLILFHKTKLRLDLATSYVSYIVIVFGFLILNEQYGFNAGWRVIQDRYLGADVIILKEHSSKEPLLLLHHKDTAFYALDLATTMTYTANSVTSSAYFSSVRLVDAKEIEAIIPAGRYTRARIDAPETPMSMLAVMNDLIGK